MMERITHIGIAVNDLDGSIAAYRRLTGVAPETIEELPEHGVRVGIFRIGDVEIELFEPLGDRGDTIRRFLAKRGDGIHHICVEVGDVASELERLKVEGFIPVGPPRLGASGKTVGFLRPISGVLFELSEKR